MRCLRVLCPVLALGLLLSSASAWAQSATSGAIAGVVRDTSGGVLPGVTVEVSSPALIEKVRSVVTDDQGNYKIVELRPGTYAVTFSLPGFSTVRREGIELTTGFTATANADLKVGSLEETVVVTGASPIVDVQNVRTQTVLSRELLDTLPTGKTVGAFAMLTLGVTGMSSPTVDVGGSKGENFLGYAVHGGRTGDGRTLLDGMDMNYGGTGSHRNQMNQALVQEVALQTRGMSAETENGGVVINYVPKDGGNDLKLYVQTSGSHPSLQSSNITDSHRAAGITEAAGIYHLYELSVGLGGPLKRDKLWFYTAHMKTGSGEYHPGLYFNATQHSSFFYTPDRSRQKFNTYDVRDHAGRLTWQATGKQKVSGSTSWEWNCQCFKLSGSVDINRAPEATQHTYFQPEVTTVTWQYTRTSRLLFEAGLLHMRDTSRQLPIETVQPGDIARMELTTNFKWGARMGDAGFGAPGADYGEPSTYHRYPHRASASYVTGSHAFKAGYMGRYGSDSLDIGPEKYGVPPYLYQLRNNVPAQVTLFATPILEESRAFELGLYAQDQWTLDRLTINAGLRFDAYNAWTPPVTTRPGMFLPAADFPEDKPGWIGKDVSPRVGGAYDLFGDGRTALKGSIGRYVQFQGAGLAPPTNYSALVVRSVTRVWNDANRNLSPDCVLTNPLANGECAQISDLNFGNPRPATAYDYDELRGWQKRSYSWQLTGSMQHQLSDHVGVNAGYYRTWYGNFTVTQNRAVTPADFDPYCITVPADSRLPNSGESICGLFDIRPEKFGQVDSFVTTADNFGGRSEVYNGFDVSLSTRFGSGKLLQGGVSMGRTVVDRCALNEFPNVTGGDLTASTPRSEAYCHVAPPFTSTAQVKVSGVYPLVWDLQLSGTLQNINTFALQATRVTPNAEIVPSLGRNLGSCRGAATCTGTVSIPLLQPNTEFGDRLTQIDLRLTRTMRIAGARIQGMVDLYNVLNSGTSVNVNTSYGASWLRPLTIVGGRLLKFGAQLDW